MSELCNCFQSHIMKAGPFLLSLYQPLMHQKRFVTSALKPHMLCEQYRYRQWIRRGNIIIIVPDPPPDFSQSVARSADFPASVEDSCCNFSSVWAVNNILCRAASHISTDAHAAVISVSGCLPLDSHHPPFAHGRFMCISGREKWRGGEN